MPSSATIRRRQDVKFRAWGWNKVQMIGPQQATPEQVLWGSSGRSAALLPLMRDASVPMLFRVQGAMVWEIGEIDSCKLTRPCLTGGTGEVTGYY
eukprot:1971849-Rhodomonas_salina.3